MPNPQVLAMSFQLLEIAGEEIYQAYIGSSANPGYRDFAIAAEMVKGKTCETQCFI